MESLLGIILVVKELIDHLKIILWQKVVQKADPLRVDLPKVATPTIQVLLVINPVVAGATFRKEDNLK